MHLFPQQQISLSVFLLLNDCHASKAFKASLTYSELSDTKEQLDLVYLTLFHYTKQRKWRNRLHLSNVFHRSHVIDTNQFQNTSREGCYKYFKTRQHYAYATTQKQLQSKAILELISTYYHCQKNCLVTSSHK